MDSDTIDFINMADGTRDEYELQFTDIFDQIVDYAAGTPSNVVNPDVLTRARQPFGG